MSTPSPHEDHRRLAENRANEFPVSCAVMTISDTRTPETDQGGPLIASHIKKSGHVVAAEVIVPDDAGKIREQLVAWIAEPDLHVIITTGGTGISRRDITIEVVRPLLSYELPGFGELFRMLSFEQVKSASMLSRALAGLAVDDQNPMGDTFVFALPGSPNAVELAMAELIIPQIPHLVWQRTK